MFMDSFKNIGMFAYYGLWRWRYTFPIRTISNIFMFIYYSCFKRTYDIACQPQSYYCICLN